MAVEFTPQNIQCHTKIRSVVQLLVAVEF